MKRRKIMIKLSGEIERDVSKKRVNERGGEKDKKREEVHREWESKKEIEEKREFIQRKREREIWLEGRDIDTTLEQIRVDESKTEIKGTLKWTSDKVQKSQREI